MISTLPNKFQFLNYQYILYVVFKINTLPNDKFLDWSKLKEFADDKNKCDSKFEIRFWKGRKHCWKRTKCWLPAFSPFFTKFSKAFFFRLVRSRDCVVKSWYI